MTKLELDVHGGYVALCRISKMSVPQQGHYYPPYGGHTPHQMPAMQYNTHQYAPSHYNTFSQQMPPAQRVSLFFFNLNLLGGNSSASSCCPNE